MNHVYRLKRSGRTQQLQAVPENARSAGKGAASTGKTLGQSVSATLASFALSGIAALLHAQQAPPTSPPTAPSANQLPQGGVVTRGSASINTGTSAAGNALMTVNQSSNRAVIDWSSFNVGASAKVQFNQPSNRAVVLNQILGNNASQIYGQISANGQVFLSNGNGIYFSPTAQVNVGALVATTGKANIDDFMAGKTVFNRDGSTGSIVNDGQLSAALGGYIALLAPEVRNQGVVVAQAGTVALASGEAVTLNFNSGGTGLAGITTTPQTIAALVENRSAVLAEGGYIVLSAHALASLQGSVVKNSGQLSASSLSTKGGKIVLMGDSIALTGTSRIEASGATGGGTVLVGGDWQGSGDTRQATQVTMAQGASIEANATQQGDGGKVVLWSDIHNPNGVTQVKGRIWAKGGDVGGNGGAIETSGHVLTINDLKVSTAAPRGKMGQWLLDPYDVTISSASTSNINTVTGGYQASGNSSVLNISTLNAALGSSDVEIQTVGAGVQTGNITLSADVIWNAATQLKLSASGQVLGLAKIDMQASGSSVVFNTLGTASGVSYSGVISGLGAVIKTGTGNQTLTGYANTYTGGTQVLGGVLYAYGDNYYSGVAGEASGLTGC